MIYIPTHKNLADSWQLSADLWKQTAGETSGETQYLLKPQVHPNNGNVYFRTTLEQAEALELDTENALHEWPEYSDAI